MADEPTARDVVRAMIRQHWGLLEGTYAPEATELADRIVDALAEAGKLASPRVAAELVGLRAEIPKALYRTPLGEVMGRGVTNADVPLIAALLEQQSGT